MIRKIALLLLLSTMVLGKVCYFDPPTADCNIYYDWTNSSVWAGDCAGTSYPANGDTAIINKSGSINVDTYIDLYNFTITNNYNCTINLSTNFSTQNYLVYSPASGRIYINLNGYNMTFHDGTYLVLNSTSSPTWNFLTYSNAGNSYGIFRNVKIKLYRRTLGGARFGYIIIDNVSSYTPYNFAYELPIMWFYNTAYIISNSSSDDVYFGSYYSRNIQTNPINTTLASTNYAFGIGHFNITYFPNIQGEPSNLQLRSLRLANMGNETIYAPVFLTSGIKTNSFGISAYACGGNYISNVYTNSHNITAGTFTIAFWSSTYCCDGALYANHSTITATGLIIRSCGYLYGQNATFYIGSIDLTNATPDNFYPQNGSFIISGDVRASDYFPYLEFKSITFTNASHYVNVPIRACNMVLSGTFTNLPQLNITKNLVGVDCQNPSAIINNFSSPQTIFADHPSNIIIKNSILLPITLYNVTDNFTFDYTYEDNHFLANVTQAFETTELKLIKDNTVLLESNSSSTNIVLPFIRLYRAKLFGRPGNMIYVDSGGNNVTIHIPKYEDNTCEVYVCEGVDSLADCSWQKVAAVDEGKTCRVKVSGSWVFEEGPVVIIKSPFPKLAIILTFLTAFLLFIRYGK